jgi:hypothetical protein
MASISYINSVALANISYVNPTAAAYIGNVNGVDFTPPVTGHLTLNFSGTMPTNGDSVAVSPDAGGWITYGTVSGTSTTVDWESTWGASGNTPITVETYGLLYLVGYVTITSAEVTTLNSGGNVSRSVTMSEV